MISHYTPPWLKRALYVKVTRNGTKFYSARSHGASSKGSSGIHKSTAISHSHHTRTDGDDHDDGIELTRPETGHASLELDRMSHPGLSSLPQSPQHSQPLGVTTEITSGASRH